MARIDAFLKLGFAQGGSDVHLAVGVPPMLRMNGDLVPINVITSYSIHYTKLYDTNLQALIDAARSDRLNATICAVLSDRADAYGLERARAVITSYSIHYTKLYDR